MSNTFRIGDMTIHRIVEQEYGFTPMLEFLPTLTKEAFEENRSWLAPGGYDRDDRQCRAVLPVLCRQDAAPQHPGRCLHRQRQELPAAAGLEQEERRQLDGGAEGGRARGRGHRFRHVHAICTAIMSAGTRGWRTAAGSRPSRRRATCSRRRNTTTGARSTRRRRSTTITDSVLPIIEANRAELVTSDHALNDHIRLTPTPGHTPDHFAVCAGEGGDEAVFTGDLIHSPIQARYPELVMRVDTDRDQARRRRGGVLRALLRHRHAVLHDALPVALGRPHQALGRRLPLRIRHRLIVRLPAWNIRQGGGWDLRGPPRVERACNRGQPDLALPDKLNATLSRHAGHWESHASRAFEVYATDLFDNQLRLGGVICACDQHLSVEAVEVG